MHLDSLRMDIQTVDDNSRGPLTAHFACMLKKMNNGS